MLKTFNDIVSQPLKIYKYKTHSACSTGASPHFTNKTISRQRTRQSSDYLIKKSINLPYAEGSEAILQFRRLHEKNKGESKGKRYFSRRRSEGYTNNSNDNEVNIPLLIIASYNPETHLEQTSNTWLKNDLFSKHNNTTSFISKAFHTRKRSNSRQNKAK
ncbi:hypothetical protein SteCoe_22879 [Stentor coeruleus]|uniref:Uncharacterized protein n=1 Tax=Stentor coeruleus TaxID=5963 RepID=A0A1R2BL79_9CILI|nr:hypothetical protein SteCoe_22879 [Stentor coeruleus]